MVISPLNIKVEAIITLFIYGIKSKVKFHAYSWIEIYIKLIS